MPKYLAKYYRNVFLVGLPGVGKSALGKAYAQLSGRDFLDLDRYIERDVGKTIAQIFQEEGEEAFREHETRLLKSLEHRQNLVVSLGGGALMRKQNLELVQKIGLVVTLQCPIDVLANRVFSEKSIRPMFANMQNLLQVQEKLEELSLQRNEGFLCSDIFVNTAFSSIDNLKLEIGLKEKKKYHEEKRRAQQKEALSKASPSADFKLPFRLDTRVPKNSERNQAKKDFLQVDNKLKPDNLLSRHRKQSRPLKEHLRPDGHGPRPALRYSMNAKGALQSDPKQAKVPKRDFSRIKPKVK